MFVKDKYLLEFGHLPIGNHNFDFAITKELFEKFDNQDVLASDIKFNVILNNTEELISLRFMYEGSLTVACDRCLANLDLQIKSEDVLYIKLSDNNEQTDDDNLIVLPKQANNVDLSLYIYECILLQKPFRCVHGEVNEQTCDKEMLGILSLNEKKEKGFDQRWSALKEYIQ